MGKTPWHCVELPKHSRTFPTFFWPPASALLKSRTGFRKLRFSRLTSLRGQKKLLPSQSQTMSTNASLRFRFAITLANLTDLAKFAKLWWARSQLYRSHVLQVDTRFPAVVKLYKMCALLCRCFQACSHFGFQLLHNAKLKSVAKSGSNVSDNIIQVKCQQFSNICRKTFFAKHLKFSQIIL